MSAVDVLGPAATCPVGAACAVCGGSEDLDVATYDTPLGVFCATVCARCADVHKPPLLLSWGRAAELVAGHCDHLGIDVDQMATIRSSGGA
jgi:hypothetical protein